jgi:hypothetical protein
VSSWPSATISTLAANPAIPTRAGTAMDSPGGELPAGPGLFARCSPEGWIHGHGALRSPVALPRFLFLRLAAGAFDAEPTGTHSASPCSRLNSSISSWGGIVRPTPLQPSASLQPRARHPGRGRSSRWFAGHGVPFRSGHRRDAQGCSPALAPGGYHLSHRRLPLGAGPGAFTRRRGRYLSCRDRT